MMKFFFKTLILLFIVLSIVTICVIMPPSSVSKNYMLSAQIDKNNLLRNTPGPRIIFVGGSNLNFGLNSKIVKDSLHMNPINTGLHAGIGLKYMLSNTINYVRENDIIVLAPEYQQFYGDLADGEVEVLKLVIDIAPQMKNLSLKQFIKLVPFFPEYSSSKLRIWNYLKKADTTIIGIHDRKSFNSFGDGYIHWQLPKEAVMPFEELKGSLNEDVFTYLNRFRDMVRKRNAKLFVTFPCCQDISFNRSIVQIHNIEKRLKEDKFILLGTPERYVVADSLTFNTPYHLIKKGVDYRTILLLDDLKTKIRPAS